MPKSLYSTGKLTWPQKITIKKLVDTGGGEVNCGKVPVVNAVKHISHLDTKKLFNDVYVTERFG